MAELGDVEVIIRAPRRMDALWSLQRGILSRTRQIKAGMRRGLSGLSSTNKHARTEIAVTSGPDRLGNGTADALRLAHSPCVVLAADDVQAANAADAALVAHCWLPTQKPVACDLLLMTSDDASDMRLAEHVIIADDSAALRRLLQEAAADAEVRTALVMHAVDLRGVSSAAQIWRLLLAEAQAHDLTPRHALRLSLEAILRECVYASACRPLCNLLLRAALQGPTAVSTVAAVLQLLEACAATSSASQVITLLLASEILPAVAVHEYAALETAKPEWRVLLRALLQPGAAAAGLGLADDPGGASAVVGEVPSAIDMELVSTSPTDEYTPVRVMATEWDGSSAAVALNAVIGSTREAVVVLDGLVDETMREELLTYLRGSGPAGTAPPATWWDRKTLDSAGLPPSWGLRRQRLMQLTRDPPRCCEEVVMRCCLSPRYRASVCSSCFW